ncbi:hypothetical protein L7F22_033447 [Adiantum nelumboides]|nr:hypothetical protein [Adiantum nelumboides]
MDAYTLIKVFEIKKNLQTSLGIVRINGEPTYKKTHSVITHDDLYHDLFEFVVANDFVLSVKQEEKWVVESNVVYIRGATLNSSNHLSSKGFCTCPVESVHEEHDNQNCESLPSIKELPLMAQSIVDVWEEECRRIRLKLSNMIVPMDDHFELKIEKLEGHGCSICSHVVVHITSRKDLFCSLDAAPAGKKVTCANNASYPIKGVGKILITISDGSDLCLPDVLYVPGIKKNLLSVSSLAKNGLRVIFEDDRCIVRDRENGYSLITTGTLENELFVLDHYEKQIQACIAETKTRAMQDAELWHARFGHVGYGSLMTLQRHNMVHDLSLLEMPPRHVCEGCVLGKMHRFAFSQDGSVRATRKLQLVHSDVCGPMRTPSVENSLYFVTFIDDFSRFCWVYLLKAKSDVFAIFQHYISMVENETGCKVQTLRTDRAGEYMSGAFKDFLGKKGIKHQCTMPYTPQQNGVAERKNRSLMEMARCMLKAKSLPHKLWMEAVACATHVLNSYLRVFGCLAYAHIPQQLRGKLDDKAVKCIFVGYNSGSKGYRLYNPATNKIFESRDVIFAETTAQPMVAFDVPHMQTQDVFEGFLPSFVENQESQQVDNFDQSFDQHVTPHDVEEIVRKEQEVLREERTLPMWVQKTLQDSKLDAPLPRKTRADKSYDTIELEREDLELYKVHKPQKTPSPTPQPMDVTIALPSMKVEKEKVELMVEMAIQTEVVKGFEIFQDTIQKTQGELVQSPINEFEVENSPTKDKKKGKEIEQPTPVAASIEVATQQPQEWTFDGDLLDEVNEYAQQMMALTEKMRMATLEREAEPEILTKSLMPCKRQFTCRYTPQQNGVAEQKNRHIAKVVRALMSEKNVPHCYWDEAVSTAVYIMNRTPTAAVHNVTPVNRTPTAAR